MRDRRLPRHILLLAATLTWASATAQTLDRAVVAAIRRGHSAVTLRERSTIVAIVGSPTLPLVEARINGRGPFRLLIDLGSNVTLLRRDVVNATSTTVLVERATSDVIRIDSLVIGDAVFRGITGGSYDELDVDGVLGFNVLSAFSFTLDYPAMRFAFHRDTLPAPNGREVLEYQVVGRMPFVRAVAGSDTLLLNLDTGASEWMTVPLAWQDSLQLETKPADGPTVTNNQTGRVRVRTARLAALRLGRFVVERPLVYLNPDAESAWLGSGLLQHFTLTFDTRHRRVKLAVPRGDTIGLRE